MCGKPNPAEAEVCMYCQARLKPLIRPPAPEKPAGKDEADWLRGLAGSDAAPQPPAQESPAPEESPEEPAEGEMPDWLSRIRQKTQEEDDAVSPIGRPPKIEPHSDLPEGQESIPLENTPQETPDWLKDLRPPAAAGSGANWLDSLRGAGLADSAPAQADAGAAQDSGGSAEAEDQDNDDWLRSFNARVGTGDLVLPEERAEKSQPAGPAPAPQGTGAEGELPKAEKPDWLKDLGAQGAQAGELNSAEAEAPVPPQEEQAAPAEDVPDWLKSFAPEPPAPPTPPAAAAPAVPGDVPDWLKSFNFEQPPAAETPAPESTPSGEMPDWLKSFGAAEPTAPAPANPVFGQAPETSEAGEEQAAPAEAIPDWLKSFGVEQAAPETPAAMTEPAPAAAEEQAAPAEEVPDWLKSFGVEQAAVETSATAAETEPAQAFAEEQAAPAEEVPDWLKSFAAEQPAAEAPAAAAGTGPAPAFAEEQAAPAEEVPDWLKSFAAGQPAAEEGAPSGATPAFAEEQAAPAEEVPDWLKSFGTQPAQAAAEEQAVAAEAPQEEAAGAENIPDWLKTYAAEQPSAAEAAPSPEAAPAGEEAPQAGEETPEWLKAFASTAPPAQPPEGGSVPAILPEGEAAPAEAVPDWLKSYAQKEGQPAEALESEMPEGGMPEAQPEEPKFVSPFGGEALPEWMSEAPAAEPASGLIGRSEEELSAAAHPFAGEDMAEWLEQTQEEGAVQGAVAGEGAQEGIEKAQLPAWLQAMRPVESAAPASVAGVDNERVEKSGPLAGLRGILRAEDLVAQYQKPPTYSVKLRVSESQTVKTGLVEKVLADETNAQQPATAQAQTSQWLVRVATALALIALLLIVLNYGPRPLVPAALSQLDPQVNAINGLVSGLAPGAPVLVAVDYQSGLQGELNVAAQPVIQHLMQQKARLIFVATNPTGQVLAQSLFNTAQAAGSGDYPAELSANLGYLIGGSTGLQAMAAPADASANPHPLQQALPFTYSADGSWNKPALTGLNQLTDFKQVYLLTDSVEGGRDWIEQVQPTLAGAKIPLIAISSAQSAPLLQPYEASGQITAMLGGLYGGAAYEQVRQTTGAGTTYWNAYLAGLLAAILFILLGGVVSLISNLSRPKSKRKA